MGTLGLQLFIIQSKLLELNFQKWCFVYFLMPVNFEIRVIKTIKKLFQNVSHS